MIQQMYFAGVEEKPASPNCRGGCGVEEQVLAELSSNNFGRHVGHLLKELIP